MMGESLLDQARREIDRVDTQMARLFEERMAAAKMVAEYKKETGMPIFDGAREAAILARGAERVTDEAVRGYYVNFLQEVMDLSKAYQSRLISGMNVAYAGVSGAFAHLTTMRIFPDATPIGYSDFAEAYKAVTDGRCDAAVLTCILEDPTGYGRIIRDENGHVVGVVEQKRPELEIKTLNDYYTYNQSTGGTLFIPLSTWPILYRFDEPQSAVLRARSTDDMTQVGQEAAKLLTASQIRSEGSNYSYRSQDLMEQAEKLQELSNSTNRQLLWIASISLLVGGIGVMNIMLVTVTERTREIGLKKAIGARKKVILWQFLTEAAVLTGVGGVLGVIAGVALSRLISAVMGTPTAVSPGATVVALLFSTLIGVIFGLLPAIKAANLNPIDALRRE